MAKRTGEELNFGLRALRTSVGFLQGGVAKRVGVPLARYRQWESGISRPPVTMLQAIADAIGKSRYEVLDAVLETIRLARAGNPTASANDDGDDAGDDDADGE